MKLTYATDVNAANIHEWSGLSWYYRQMLEQAGCEVQVLDKWEMPPPLLSKVKIKFFRKFSSKLYASRFSLAMSRYYARTIHKKAAPGSVIFSPNTVVFAYLNKSFKKVLFADATFDSLLHLYPKYRQFSKGSIKSADIIDRKAINNADLLIYTSKWAADSAIKKYNADPSKIHILPFGANLDQIPDAGAVQQGIQQRAAAQKLNLLFLGIDWLRKGGEYALQVTKQLNEKGIPATLHVVGVTNLPADVDGTYMVHHQFISKATVEGQKKLGELLMQSHFLLLPSLADCTPVACSEASLFGVPCLTSNVGGFQSVVEENRNGFTFPLNQYVEQTTALIQQLRQDKMAYVKLCQNSYERYCSELNWKTTGEKIVQLIQALP